MKNLSSQNLNRYHLIDSLRGFAILNMVVFHIFYDLFEIYNLGSGWYFQPLTVVWEKFICVSFILISGISLNFSKHAYRRGITVCLCGFCVTAVTVLIMPDEAVRFGILSFLGCAMLVCRPLSEYFDKINPAAAAVVSLLLYMITYGVPMRYVGFFGIKILELPDFLYNFKFLSFLGFPSDDFFSTDFFPLIPWIFLFISGCFLWRCVEKFKIDYIFRFKIPLLNEIGKFSLWIYMLHQVIIIGVCFLIFGYI